MPDHPGLSDAATRLLARARHPVELHHVHNPWRHAAMQADAWAMLDACLAAGVIAAVVARLGPDVILWGSQLLPPGVVPPEEGPFWPADPLAGVVALIPGGAGPLRVAALGEASAALDQPVLVARYIPATSHFRRDAGFAAHVALAAGEPLLNHALLPLWQAAGVDRAGNDFVAGFAPTPPAWAPPAPGAPAAPMDFDPPQATNRWTAA